jgi:hypothetical protein
VFLSAFNGGDASSLLCFLILQVANFIVYPFDEGKEITTWLRALIVEDHIPDKIIEGTKENRIRFDFNNNLIFVFQLI